MTLLTIAAASHPGMRKKQNEDFYDYFPPEKGRTHPKGILLALADGMGGRAGGELASRTAVRVLLDAYYQDSGRSIPDALYRSFLKANEAVIDEGRKDWQVEGMATTLTAVVVQGNRLFYAHVGDSRGYVVRQNRLSHFTEDHSYVASLVKAGAITEEQARDHPQANLITQAVGAKPELKIDCSREPLKLENGQRVMICCDGLYKVVPEEEILKTMDAHPNPASACTALVEKANELGGPDNITVLIARVDKVEKRFGIIGRLIDGFRGNGL